MKSDLLHFRWTVRSAVVRHFESQDLKAYTLEFQLPVMLSCKSAQYSAVQLTLAASHKVNKSTAQRKYHMLEGYRF